MSIDKQDNEPVVLLSTASFYFWLPHYDPLLSLELIGGLGPIGVDGFDIYLDPRDGGRLIGELTDEHLGLLSKYSHHCLHTDLFGGNWCETATDKEVETALREIDGFRKLLGVSDVVIHGDYLYKDSERRLGLIRSALPEAKVHLELMGKDKVFATHADQFRRLLEQEPAFYITPDLAHMQDWRNEYTWREVFEDPLLSKHIQLVHASHHTQCLRENWYLKNGHAECSGAVHSLMQCDSGYYDGEILASLLRGKKVVLEGIIPLQVDLSELLSREKALIGIVG